MLKEWFFISLWIGLSFVIGVLLFTIVYSLVPKSLDLEKLSAYECGFNPFEEVYGRFDIKFYLVAILFIIFDLEVSYLFPWSVIMGFVGLFGYLFMFLFLFLLLIGFLYEWERGSLEW